MFPCDASVEYRCASVSSVSEQVRPVGPSPTFDGLRRTQSTVAPSGAGIGAAGPAFGPARAREGKRFAGGWPRCPRHNASSVPCSRQGEAAMNRARRSCDLARFAARFVQTGARDARRCVGATAHGIRRLRWHGCCTPKSVSALPTGRRKSCRPHEVRWRTSPKHAFASLLA